MGCNFPIPARQDTPGGEITLHPSLGTANLCVPCGHCLGCTAERAAEWAARATHEAQLHDRNIFITLTYSDDHLPTGLDPPALQRFLKRLRKRATTDSTIQTDGTGIRFLACGEYGDTTQRPHYHAILYNCDLADKHKCGKDLYESDTLTKLWPYGANRIGAVTPASAAYVAKYQMKSRNIDHITPDGEVLQRPFLRMSRRPGIGAGWLEKYSDDLQHGYLVANGVKRKIPRAYIKRLQKERAQLAEEIMHRAYKRATDKGETPTERREAREKIMEHNLKARSL